MWQAVTQCVLLLISSTHLIFLFRASHWPEKRMFGELGETSWQGTVLRKVLKQSRKTVTLQTRVFPNVWVLVRLISLWPLVNTKKRSVLSPWVFISFCYYNNAVRWQDWLRITCLYLQVCCAVIFSRFALFMWGCSYFFLLLITKVPPSQNTLEEIVALLKCALKRKTNWFLPLRIKLQEAADVNAGGFEIRGSGTFSDLKI